MNEPQMVRLQKYLADQGVASRREAEKLIAAGAVRVDGELVTEMGVKVDPLSQRVEVSGKALSAKEQQKVTLAIWKPVGIVTSTKKTETDPFIFTDLLPPKYRHLFPVGRLDKDSSGLLIATNDGDLAFRLTHPRFGHQKTYEVLLSKPITEEALQKIRTGDLKVLGKPIIPASVRILGGARIEIVLEEGKNRQIRRMFRALGNGVKKLRRVAIGRLRLEDLRVREGDFRVLGQHEISLLQQTGDPIPVRPKQVSHTKDR